MQSELASPRGATATPKQAQLQAHGQCSTHTEDLHGRAFTCSCNGTPPCSMRREAASPLGATVTPSSSRSGGPAAAAAAAAPGPAGRLRICNVHGAGPAVEAACAAAWRPACKTPGSCIATANAHMLWCTYLRISVSSCPEPPTSCIHAPLIESMTAYRAHCGIDKALAWCRPPQQPSMVSALGGSLAAHFRTMGT